MASSKEVVNSEDRPCCSICLENFTNPRTLPCLHTFCHLCLSAYVKQLGQKHSLKGFNCPFCRAFILLPVEQASKDMFLDNLPDNINLLSISLSPKANMSNNNGLCESCRRETVDVTATWYCFECDEKLCEICTTHHRKNKASFKHQIEIIHSSQNDTRVSKLEVLKAISKCPNHPLKNIEFNCNYHEQLCCSNCAVFEHRTCDQLVSVTKLENVLSYERLQEKLGYLDSHASLILCSEVRRNVDLESSQECVKTKLAETKKRFEKTYDEIEKAILQVSSNAHRKMSERITNQMKIIETFKSGIFELKELMDTASKYGDEIVMILVGRKLQNSIRQYEIKIRDIYVEANAQDIELIENEPIDSIVDSLKTCMGIKIRTHKPDWPNCPFRFAVMNSEFNCTRKKEITSYVRGCVWVEDDIVVIDCNACELKVFEIETKRVLETYTFASQPWSITKITNSEVAVSLPHEHKIYVMCAGRTTITLKHMITTSKPYYGLAYAEKENLLIASSRKDGSLTLLQVDGTQARCVQLEKNTTSAVMVAYCIAIDNNSEVCYISSHGLNKIIAINLQGHVLFSYEDPGLKYPWMIQVDADGNVFVCSGGSDSIYQLDKTGIFRCRVLTSVDGLVKPFSLCFNKSMHKLAVTTNDIGKEIKIYDFHKSGIYTM